MDLLLHTLLVDGFIHEIDNNLMQIIPLQLNKLCFAYFIDIEKELTLRNKRINAKISDNIGTVIRTEKWILYLCAITMNVQEKINDNNDNIAPFNSTMTMQDAYNLDVNDCIDHRDIEGRFLSAKVIKKEDTNLKIHYVGWSNKWDIWSDFRKDLDRFAKHKSISKRKANRFTELKKGDYIDINPIQTTNHGAWKCAEIEALDDTSGQIKVVYKYGGQCYSYWAHLDNKQEIAEFTTKSASNEELMKEILNDWMLYKQIDVFRDSITNYIMKCIEYDNIVIFKILCKYYGCDDIKRFIGYNGYDNRRNEEIFKFINHAAKYNAFECIKLLLNDPFLLNWSYQPQPICLLNAIKKTPHNMELIHFIIDKVQLLERVRVFQCDDIMEKCICYDLADIAKRIILNRWYKVTDFDKSRVADSAEKCYQLFTNIIIQRENAFNFINIYGNNDDNDHVINLDDDEWGNQEVNDDDFDIDNDDWENAMD